MLRELGECEACGHTAFKITVTREDGLTLDSQGKLEEKDGTDSVSAVSCASCGTVALNQSGLTDDETAGIFWELERQVLET